MLLIENKSEMFVVKTNGYYEAQFKQSHLLNHIFSRSITVPCLEISLEIVGTPREFCYILLYTQDNEIFQDSLARYLYL